MNRKERRRQDKLARQQQAGGFAEAALQAAVRHFQAGELDQAAKILSDVRRAQPRNYDAAIGLAVVHASRGDLDAAVPLFEAAAALRPGEPEAHFNLGRALTELGRADEAAAAYRRALAVDPNHRDSLLNLGTILKDKGDLDAAADHYRRALARDPSLALAHNNLGNVYSLVNDWQAAIEHYRRALSLEPAEDRPVVNLATALINACDWKDLAAVRLRAEACFDRRGNDKKDEPAENPLACLTLSADLGRNHRVAAACAGFIARRVAGSGVSFPMAGRRKDKSTLRIGYLSHDFRNHVVGHLAHRMFGLHDRAGFTVFGYSSGPNDGSVYRQAIEDGCDAFVDIGGLSTVETATRIHRDGIDILIDLNGFTEGNRLEAAAMRPAPVQVSYLGFPGTVGGDIFDYIIFDDVVLAEAEEIHVGEKVIYLPPYYVVSDRPLDQPRRRPTRAEAGLPESGVVFCSFNKPNKIEPAMFGRWMNILKALPGSVLWLLADNPTATSNLKNEAGLAGVDAERLVFAEKVPKPEHAARVGLADIALDTRIFNGGATTADALAAGVPVVALKGAHVPSRASASMLTALGMPELIAADLDAYEALALRLAGDAAALARIKAAVAAKADASPLFDIAQKVRGLEQAYRRIWSDYARGNPRVSFKVEPGQI